jgi:DNA-binding NarL/FixJ family response regulator
MRYALFGKKVSGFAGRIRRTFSEAQQWCGDLENSMLTERELSVLELIAKGGTDRDIAGTLAIKIGTARKHRENLQTKLHTTRSAQLVPHYFQAACGAVNKPAQRTPAPFSARETEVLELLAEGMTDKEVARRLGLSDHTVRRHRAHLLAKADAGNICALLFRAIAAGWIPLRASNASL